MLRVWSYIAELQSGSSIMASFNTYYSVGLIIPSVILGVIYFFSGVVGIYLLMAAKRYPEGYVYRLPLVIRLMISTIFLLLKIERVEEQATSSDSSTIQESEYKPQYFELRMENIRLKNRSTAMAIAIIAVTVIGCSFVTLWTVLFIDESTTCGEAGFDCFFSGRRVKNCTIFDNAIVNGTDYGRIECYCIDFNYIQAIAAAGGVTFITSVVVNLLTVMIIAISSIRSETCRLFTTLLFSIFLLLLPVAVILCNIYVPAFKESSFPNMFRLWVYFASFYMSVVAGSILSLEVLTKMELPCLDNLVNLWKMLRDLKSHYANL